MVFHPLEGVIEPPARTELDLAPDGCFLEGSASAGEDGVVPRVEVVDDGLGELVEFAEGIEEGKKSLALRPVADGVEPGIRADLIKEPGVWIPLGPKMELHRPVLFGNPLADVIHDEGSEGIGLGRSGGLTFAGLGEDAVGFAFMAGIGEGVAHAVVGHATAFFVEVILALFESVEKVGEGRDVLAKLIEPSIEEGRAIDEEGFIRTEGGIDFGGTIGGVGDLVVGEIVGGVISGADGINSKFPKEALG